MTKPRQSLAEMKSQLRAPTPMDRLIRYEDWIEQNAPLMIELGFESELGRLREEAADIRANLESSGGAASPKDQLRMAQWRSEQLDFALAAEAVTLSRRQSVRGKKPRRDREVEEIILRLSKRTEKASELWVHFISSMEAEGMNPVVREVAGSPLVDYETDDKKRRMTLKTFSNRISGAR